MPHASPVGGRRREHPDPAEKCEEEDADGKSAVRCVLVLDRRLLEGPVGS